MNASLPPISFNYVEPTSMSASDNTPMSTTRGFTCANPNGSETFVGEHSDISKYVHCYFFDNESGKLTVQLKENCILSYVDRERRRINESAEGSRSVIFAIDAVLNQLAITVFKMPMDLNCSDHKTIGLLKGQQGYNDNLKTVPGFIWSRLHYDDKKLKKIAFEAIDDFAFDKNSYSLELDGNRFSLTLKDDYRNHPGVLYALDDVLGRKCSLTRKLEE